MAETFNPFSKWLGLKPNIKNPHHFQLLGVSTKLVDDAEIKKAVEAGVKRNLGLLARVRASPKVDPVIAKLKQRIAVAQKTLSDPKLRGAYKAKLKSQIEAAQKASVGQKEKGGGVKSSAIVNPKPGSVGDLLPPSTKPRTAKPADIASPPAAKVPDSTVPVPAQPSTPADLAPPPQSQPQAPAHPIPAAPAPPNQTTPEQPIIPPIQAATTGLAQAQPAIPLAVPLSPDQLANVATANPAVITQAATVPSTPDLPILNDGGTPDVGEVKINKKRVKRKRSILAPLMMIMMIGAGGVGVWFIYDNFDALKNLGKKTEVVKKPAEVEQPEKLAAVDPEKLEELDEKKIFEESDVDDPLNEDDPEKVVPIESEKMPSDVAEPKLVSLDDSQLARLRRSLERGHRSLFRRDHQMAAEMFRAANEVASEVLTGEDEQFIDAQQSMIENVADSSGIIKLVDGFWKQVHDSAESLSGAQEIIVGSQIVGFVESRPDSVIVRRSGANIEYGYSFCPPGLALALAEQGALPDVPIWNKQKAAFYAVDQMFGVDHRSQIDSFLKLAEAAGHDCDFIRRFSDFRLGSLGRPEQKVEMPDNRTIDEALAEFRSDADYDNIRKLDPADALKHAQLLIQIDSPNFEQHVAILEETRRLGIRGGDATIVEDAIIELSLYAKIQRAELTCDSFAKIAEEKLTPKQVRDLMERSIGFLNSPFSDGAKPKTQQTLVKRLLKLSERAQMPDAYRRLNQINL